MLVRHSTIKVHWSRHLNQQMLPMLIITTRVAGVTGVPADPCRTGGACTRISRSGPGWREVSCSSAVCLWRGASDLLGRCGTTTAAGCRDVDVLVKEHRHPSNSAGVAVICRLHFRFFRYPPASSSVSRQRVGYCRSSRRVFFSLHVGRRRCSAVAGVAGVPTGPCRTGRAGASISRSGPGWREVSCSSAVPYGVCRCENEGASDPSGRRGTTTAAGYRDRDVPLKSTIMCQTQRE